MVSRIRRDIDRLLLNAAGVSKISIDFQVVKIEIEKTQFLEMLRASALASRTVSTVFVERRVFWEDLTGEEPRAVRDSLKEAGEELAAYEVELSKSSDIAAIGFARIVLAWKREVVLTWKTLRDRLAEIDEEKASVLGYDHAGEDRHDAMVEALVRVRTSTYPFVRMLTELIDDDDFTKADALKRVAEGMELLSASQALEVDPEFDLGPGGEPDPGLGQESTAAKTPKQAGGIFAYLRRLLGWERAPVGN